MASAWVTRLVSGRAMIPVKWLGRQSRCLSLHLVPWSPEGEWVGIPSTRRTGCLQGSRGDRWGSMFSEGVLSALLVWALWQGL